MHPKRDSNVVLPLPDGPIRKTLSPRAVSRLTPFRIAVPPRPTPKLLWTSRATIVDFMPPSSLVRRA
jgi:hypothetical protein